MKQKSQKMSFDQDFLKYLNLAREHPAYFVPALEKQMSEFINQREIALRNDVIYETNQGRPLWEQTIKFLMSQRPLPPLKKHIGLLRSAQDHKNDLCSTGKFGHIGSDGSTFSQRILRYCKKGPGAMAEIIGSDFDFPNRNTPQMTILGLIIDDGVKERGHRKTIFNPTYQYVGWSSGKQGQKILTIFNLTENNLEQQYKLANDYFTVPKKENVVFSKSQGFELQKNLRDTTNLSYDLKINSVSKKSDLPVNSHKKVAQKFEDSKAYYQGDCKIIETTIRYIYKDGTVQQNVQKRTIYMEQ